MAEDFRVTVTFRDANAHGWLADRLRTHEVEDDVRDRLGGRVSVSSSDDNVFLYTDSATAAAEAEQVVRSIARDRGLDAHYVIERWHPVEEQWEDVSEPLPSTEAEREAERGRLEADEEAQSEASGYADWEVRVDLPSHHEAVALAERLEAEGHRPLRRWTYVILGANTEDDARALANAVQQETADAAVTVEPSLGMVQGTFAFFGPG